MGEAGEIGRAGKKSGVAGDAAHHAGVFVMHFALDDAMAESAVIVGRRNERALMLAGD